MQEIKEWTKVKRTNVIEDNDSVTQKRRRRTLERLDEPNDRFLNTLAASVIADKLQSIALDLKMRPARFSQILADNPKDSKAQAFKVRILFIYFWTKICNY